MKKITLFLIFLLVAVTYTTAQKTVALNSNGTTTIFGGDSPLIDAYDASITGDTLYVSGGNFAAPTNIDKGLVIIGAGYDTDSTAVTGKTYIWSSTINSGRIVIGSNASNLYMEGMQFQGGLVKTDPDITGFTLIRLKIADIAFTNTGLIPTNASIIQCNILGDFDINGVRNSVISNCILRGRIRNSNTNVFKNNIITNESGFGTLANCDTNTFKNNIFSNDYQIADGNCSYNNYQYNIFVQLTYPLGASETDINNYHEIDLTTIYVNEVGGDYHLLGDASTTYLGDDGTEVGIYGGLVPFKEGAVPINPHISQKSIQTTTDSNGLLNISFTVEAQQN